MNSLTGSLPPSLGKLSKLMGELWEDISIVVLSLFSFRSRFSFPDLILRENQLSSTLPTEYGLHFSSLRRKLCMILQMCPNKTICSLIFSANFAFVELSLGENQLRGSIPHQIQHMTNLMVSPTPILSLTP